MKLQSLVPSSQVSQWHGRSPIIVPSARKEITFPLDTTDNKGLFWYLGTEGYTKPFVNPGEFCVPTRATPGLGAGSIASQATNRIGSNNSWHSAIGTGAYGLWFEVYMPTGWTFVCSHVRVQQRTDDNQTLHQSVSVRGGTTPNAYTAYPEIGSLNDGSMTESQGAWNTVTCSGSTAYKLFWFGTAHVATGGAWYFVVGQIELFGTLRPV